MHKIITIITISIFLSSCKNDITSSFTPKPVALGKLNNIAAIADKEIWEGMVGDTFRHYYESPYPIMPRPEPMFDLKHYTADDLAAEPLRKELRTYVVVCDLSDKESPTTKMVRRDIGEERYNKALHDTTFTTTAGVDKWAQGQLVVYLMGRNRQDVVDNVKKSFTTVAERVHKHDQKQLAANVYSLTKEDVGTKNQIKELFGIDINIPGDYKSVIIANENFALFKKDKPKYAQSIVIRKFAYSDKNQLTKSSIIKMRNDYGKIFITGSTAGSHMRTNEVDLPIYDYTYVTNGAYTKEIRGIWELTEDFVGGPFASYAMINEDRKEIVFIDTFVLASTVEKRDYMQQLEHIVKGAKLVGSSTVN